MDLAEAASAGVAAAAGDEARAGLRASRLVSASTGPVEAETRRGASSSGEDEGVVLAAADGAVEYPQHLLGVVL